jgi:hypothetical protein
MLADDDIQMIPCPYVWLKFVFCPFSTHEGILVLLLAKKLDQPIHHFTFSCNKQISIEESSFNKYIIDTHWTKLNVTSFNFKSSHHVLVFAIIGGFQSFQILFYMVIMYQSIPFD